MEAGSTLNGDVHITAPIYQDAATPNATPTEANKAKPTNTASETQDLFHFVHPALEDEEAWKVHRETERLVRRFGIQEICGHLCRLREDKKLLLPQNVKIAYDELARMGMPITQKGFDYKTFAKYYNK